MVETQLLFMGLYLSSSRIYLVRKTAEATTYRLIVLLSLKMRSYDVELQRYTTHSNKANHQQKKVAICGRKYVDI